MYYDLYVVLDIFSRYVVAWCVAPSESGELAKELIADAVARHRVPPDQLTIHADRGSSMTSNPVTELLTFLGHRPQPQPTACEQRQSLQRGAVQDPQVLPGIPRAVRLYRGRPRVLPRRSSPTTTTSTATRASATTRRPRCTTAPRRRFAPSGPRPSMPPTRRTRTGSATADRSLRSCQPRRGSTSLCHSRSLYRRRHKKVSQIGDSTLQPVKWVTTRRQSECHLPGIGLADRVIRASAMETKVPPSVMPAPTETESMSHIGRTGVRAKAQGVSAATVWAVSSVPR